VFTVADKDRCGESIAIDATKLVMAGLVPAIHVFAAERKQDVDARDKPGHDKATRHFPPFRHSPPERGNPMKRLMILNGPNLNLLGVREPHIYGTTTLAQIKENCERHAAQLGLALAFHQSNHEGQLVDWIQSARQTADAIIINPAAYSFTSIAIIDAIKAFEGPVLEVHISNIHARDELHRHSKISSAATAVICGLGPYGYIAAMHAVAEMAKKA
jgi:3-dehydroquinate dehydratase II